MGDAMHEEEVASCWNGVDRFMGLRRIVVLLYLDVLLAIDGAVAAVAQSRSEHARLVVFLLVTLHIFVTFCQGRIV